MFLDQGEIIYKAIRNIYPGEELLVYYGHEYAKNLGINTEQFVDCRFPELCVYITEP